MMREQYCDGLSVTCKPQGQNLHFMLLLQKRFDFDYSYIIRMRLIYSITYEIT